MRATCPECGTQGHVATFFIEEEGKRLALITTSLGPELGRTTLSYLGLFKPAKQGVRLARAVKLAQEVADLVAVGSVCKDERSGVRRPATRGHWLAGMETMLAQRASLALPLDSHNYLRAVVFGLADKADAKQERRREEDARAGRHLSTATGITPSPHAETPLESQLKWIDRMVEMDQFTPEIAEAERAKAREKYGSQ